MTLSALAVPAVLQAYQLRKHVSELPNSLQLQAVIVSPLTRAIETAIGAFGGAVCQEGDTVKPLMIAQNALEVTFTS